MRAEKGIQSEWIERMSKQVGLLSLYQDKFEVSYLNELLITELKYKNLGDFKTHIGNSVLEIVHPEDLEEFRRFLLLKTEYPENPKFKCRLRCKDNSFTWYEVSRVHCVGREQKPMLLCTLINVSGYMKFPKKMYQAATLQNGEIVIRIEVEEKTAYIPVELAAKYNLPEKFLNMPYSLIESGYILDESVVDYLKFYGKIVKGEEGTVEVQSRGIDGVTRWLYGKSVVKCNEEGKAVTAVVSFLDITEKKKKEIKINRLQQSEMFFKKVAELSERIILKYEFHTDCFIPVTGRAGKILEKFPESLSPLKIVNAQFIEDEYLWEVHRAFYNMKKEARDGSLCVRIKSLSAEKRWKWYKFTYYVIVDSEKQPTHAIIFCDDITKMRSGELAEQCLENNLNRKSQKPVFNLVYNLSLDAFEKSEGMVPGYYADGVIASYSKAFDWICGQVLPEYREKFRKCFSKNILLKKGEDRGEEIFPVKYKERTISVKAAYQVFKDVYTESLIIWIQCQETDVGTTEAEKTNIICKGIYIRTFGHFDIFINGKAVPIQNAKARELLALLVDKRGGFISAEEILSVLWEDEPMSTKALAKIRQTVMILKKVLKKYTEEEVIESQRGLRRLNIDIVKCDLYDYLSGASEYVSLYQGAYMPNYSWGEMMIPELNRRKVRFSEQDFYEE